MRLVAIRMSGSSVMPAGSNRTPTNVSTKAASGTPYCRPWLSEMANASMIPARVDPCLETFTKISPGRPSGYSPTVTNPLQSATRNSKVRDRRDLGSRRRTGSGTDPACGATPASEPETAAAASVERSASPRVSGWATLELSR